MTINTWRREILEICKTCRRFLDTGKSRCRYKCGKLGMSIYESHNCLKTFEVRKQAAEISETALVKALEELKGRGGAN